MPQHVVNRVAELLNMQGLALSRSKVLLLGIAYKKNVGDTRESPAIEIANMLKARGATVRGFDPFVDKLPKEAGDLEMLDKLDEDALRSFDCVVLTTDHDQFDYEWIVQITRAWFSTLATRSETWTSPTCIGWAHRCAQRQYRRLRTRR